MDRTISIGTYYGSLTGMLRKMEKNGRQDAFAGKTAEEFDLWKGQTGETLRKLIGLDHMETCPLEARVEERITLPDGIVRERVVIQVEPEVWMPMYILIPENRTPGRRQDCFITLAGHRSAGKYTLAGCTEIPAVKNAIESHHTDYGMQLARRGFVAVCPDSRGFGERRDEGKQGDDEDTFFSSTCFHLAHMAEPMGQTVAGMFTWDVMRLIDYLYERDEWNLDTLGCLGFSGGGMQTLWASALDDRIRQAVISGYMYGFRDSLMILNDNCSCNYVPHLWEHVDMGDIGSLIAPRPLLIQSCRGDHLNGPRGVVNAYEQVDIIRSAYRLYGREDLLRHDLRDGDHAWHEAALDGNLEDFRASFE